MRVFKLFKTEGICGHLQQLKVKEYTVVNNVLHNFHFEYKRIHYHYELLKQILNYV